MGEKLEATIDGTFLGPDAMAELTAMHLQRLGATQAVSVTFCGDGAPWIWDRVPMIIEKAGLQKVAIHEVLDNCHAAHHISLALAALGANDKERMSLYRAFRTQSRNGQWKRVVQDLRGLAEGQSAESKIYTEIAYLEKRGNAGRLNYVQFTKLGIPRGSYSEQFAADEQSAARWVALAGLKRRLLEHPEINSRVRMYRAEWNPETNCVTGLEAWGNQVFEDLWRAFEEETRPFAAEPSPSWEELEQAELLEFVEQRGRDFTGREDVIGELLAMARSLASDGNPRCACVTGPPGSGKSSLFAELFRELDGDPDVLVLANAAGATRRGSNVDAMLRRWVHKLAALLGVPDRRKWRTSMKSMPLLLRFWVKRRGRSGWSSCSMRSINLSRHRAPEISPGSSPSPGQPASGSSRWRRRARKPRPS